MLSPNPIDIYYLTLNMHVSAIIHGRSPKKEALIAELNQLSSELDFSFDALITSHQGHAADLAAKAAKTSDAIISCGGDGTHHDVVNGLMTTEERPKLALVSAGSGNDYMRILPNTSLKEKCTRINQPASHVDIIQLKTPRATSYALNMTTNGIGAEIAQTVNRRKFKMPSALNYYSAILSWLLRYQSPELSLSFNDEQMSGRFFLCAIGKGKYAGNGLGLTPQSKLDDGELGLTTIGSVNVLDFLRYQSGLKAGQQIKDPRVEYHSCKSLVISVSSGSLPIEADGEFIDRLGKGEELQIQVIPQAISIV